MSNKFSLPYESTYLMLNYPFCMSEEIACGPRDAEISIPHAPLAPTRDELSVLSPIERAGVKLARTMNGPRWKPFWTYFQRHIGALWIHLATYNLTEVYNIENFDRTDAERPVILVANHRSFFDMYTVSSILFRRARRPLKLYFPVRGKFFYDNPVGWLVNLVMGWWAMYPPFFRERLDGKKRAFDKFSVRELERICSEKAPNVVGFHPEGARNLSSDPYNFLPAQPGIGKVIFATRPQVIPVFIAGLGNDLPKQIIGNWTGGPKIRIYFGEPAELEEFYRRRGSVRTHKEIADHLMTKISELAEIDRSGRLQN